MENLLQKILLALFLIVFGVNAHSMTVKEYQTRKTNKNTQSVNLIYLKGVYEGLAWANSELSSSRKIRPIFCTPDKLAINSENVIQTLDNYISAHRGLVEPNDEVELVLMMAMMDAFPCK